MHYEVEQAGTGEEHRPAVGTHTEPEYWHVVRVFNADAVPMPLEAVATELNQVLPPEVIVVDEGVRSSTRLLRHLEIGDGQSLLTCSARSRRLPSCASSRRRSVA